MKSLRNLYENPKNAFFVQYMYNSTVNRSIKVLIKLGETWENTSKFGAKNFSMNIFLTKKNLNYKSLHFK